MRYILYAICLFCFIVALFVNDVRASKWFNYLSEGTYIMCEDYCPICGRK